MDSRWKWETAEMMLLSQEMHAVQEVWSGGASGKSSVPENESEVVSYSLQPHEL